MLFTTTLSINYDISDYLQQQQVGTMIKTGVVVNVESTSSGELIGFTISDRQGVRTSFTVTNTTTFGLDNIAGERWEASIAEAPLQATAELQRHMANFLPITVSSSTPGIATEVIESQPQNVESNLAWVGATFGIVWIGLFIYIVWIRSQVSDVQNELKQLQQT